MKIINGVCAQLQKAFVAYCTLLYLDTSLTLQMLPDDCRFEYMVQSVAVNYGHFQLLINYPSHDQKLN